MRSGLGASGGGSSSQRSRSTGDVRIIEALERGAHASFAEIARDCGVSIDTITKRHRKMLRPESRGRLCSPT